MPNDKYSVTNFELFGNLKELETKLNSFIINGQLNDDGKTFIQTNFRFVRSYDVIFFILDHLHINDELKQSFLFNYDVLFGCLLERVFAHNNNENWQKLLSHYANPEDLANLLARPKSVSSIRMSLNFKSDINNQLAQLSTLYEKLKSCQDKIKEVQDSYRRSFSDDKGLYCELSSLELCVMVHCDPWLYYAYFPDDNLDGNIKHITVVADDTTEQRIKSDLKQLLSRILKPEFLSFISKTRYPKTYEFYGKLENARDSLTKDDITSLIEELKEIEGSGLAIITRIIKITLGILAFMTVIPALCIQIFSEQGFESMFFSDSRDRALNRAIPILNTMNGLNIYNGSNTQLGPR